MNPETTLWIEKAEEDYLAAKWLLRDDSPVVLPAVFHIQQCVEKLLKGYLTECGIAFERKHDLTYLLLLCPDQTLLEKREFLEELTPYAVEFRYPGDFHPVSREVACGYFAELNTLREKILGSIAR